MKNLIIHAMAGLALAGAAIRDGANRILGYAHPKRAKGAKKRQCHSAPASAKSDTAGKKPASSLTRRQIRIAANRSRRAAQNLKRALLARSGNCPA